MTLATIVEKQNNIETDFVSIAACPTCHALLTAVTNDELVCFICGCSYHCVNGIWRFLTPEQQLNYAPFIGAYGVLRYYEGWERKDNDYYLGLPNVSANDPQAAIWQIRRQTFKALINQLTPGNQSWVLDLGAGNCWLSHHLALANYRVLALDIRVASRDALEGGNIYTDTRFIRAQAGADALPINDEQVDLCIINDVFHYLDPVTTLQNAFRILRPGGRVIIMDSPTYHLDNNGRKMIEERSLYLQNQYNIKNAPTAGKGYLVLAETLKAFHDTGFHTNVHWLEKPAKWWKWLFTRTKAARVQQELVRFPLLIGTKQKNLRLQSRHQPCQQYQYQAE